MARDDDRGEHALSLRLSEAEIGLIARAARLRGRAPNDFMRDAAVRAAEATLRDQRLIRVSGQGFADFLSVFAAAPQAAPEMAEVLRRPTPWEAGGKTAG